MCDCDNDSEGKTMVMMMTATMMDQACKFLCKGMVDLTLEVMGSFLKKVIQNLRFEG